MTKLPLLDFHYHGHVIQDQEQQIRRTLEECYMHLGHWLPESVDIRLFDTPVQLATFVEGEKAELGIKTLGDGAFICSQSRGLIDYRDHYLVLSFSLAASGCVKFG